MNQLLEMIRTAPTVIVVCCPYRALSVTAEY